MSAEPISRGVRVTAHAKINLALRVLGKRADGYHDVVTWMQPIALADELQLRLLPAEQRDATRPPSAPDPTAAATGLATEIAVHCSDPRVPTDESNLIVRAARSFVARGAPPAAPSLEAKQGSHRVHHPSGWGTDRARVAPPPPLSLEVNLLKRIPIGGGLGGGSADAAATLVGLAHLWGLSRHDARLTSAAEELGSDVPFFLGDGPAIARGRGTQLSPARGFEGWIVLVAPPFGVPTAAAYAACRPRPESTDDAAEWLAPWSDAQALSARLVNDLTPAAFSVAPPLKILHATLCDQGVRVHMSGSGSTLFALFDSEAAARQWRERARSLARHVDFSIARGLMGSACQVKLPAS